MTTRLSVILATRNNADTITAAVQSILDQTYREFEFIVIDDGSTDATPQRLDQFTDARIIRRRNETNVTLPVALNQGLQIAQGAIIARMDGDDIAYPERFARQIEFLDAHPTIGVLGTGITRMDAAGQPVKEKRSTALDHSLIVWRLLMQGAALVHPSVMFRRTALEAAGGGYDPTYSASQDLDLWLRMALAGVRLANLPDALLHFREHPGSISKTKMSDPRRRRFDVEIRAGMAGRILGAPLTDPDIVNRTRWLDLKSTLYPRDQAYATLDYMLRLRDRLIASGMIDDTPEVRADFIERAALIGRHAPAEMRYPLDAVRQWLKWLIRR